MKYNVQYTLINRDPDHSENKSSYTYLYFLCSPRQLIKKNLRESLLTLEIPFYTENSV